MSDELVDLFAKMFIARPDVKAIQTRDGGYMPHVSDRDHPDETRLPWVREDLEAHLSGDKTFGHYVLSADGQCKLITFDVDLDQTGILPTTPELPFNSEQAEYELWEAHAFQPVEDLRAAWHDRAHPGRSFMKLQFKLIAHKLMKLIRDELELPCAAAYSGAKGIHVYAFTGMISGHAAREGAEIVLDGLGTFSPTRGNNFYKDSNTDPVNGFSNLTIEVYPKQDQPSQSKGLGNLVRLPLGRNLKNPEDPTFFLDMTVGMATMQPIDPIHALTAGSLDPFRKIGE